MPHPALRQSIYKEVFMKRVFLFFLVLLMVGVFAFSADLMNYPPPLDGGNILFDVGFGLALAPSTVVRTGATIMVPPVVLTAEYCLPVGVPISLGGLVGFYMFKWNYPGGHVPYKETWTFATFGTRANWHWNIDVNWLDLYTGAFIGYNLFFWSREGSSFSGDIDPAFGGLVFGGQAGAHFYFTDRIGAVAELGYPFVTKVGLALKF
jgi:hypothetical protein